MARFFVFFATAQGAGVRPVTADDAKQAEARIRSELDAILRLSVVESAWMADLDLKAMLREWMESIRDEIHTN